MTSLINLSAFRRPGHFSTGGTLCSTLQTSEPGLQFARLPASGNQWRRHFVVVLGIVALSLGAHAVASRVTNTTLRMPAEFPIVGYGFTNAFANLDFHQPVVIASPPGETNRLFIAEKTGRIYVITNLANPTKAEFLNASQNLYVNAESGLLGLAFHPGYATNGYFYIYRTVGDTLDGSYYGMHDELARFSVDPQNPNRALAGSKLRILSQYDVSDLHNAGDIHFGPDGYLYLSIGYQGPSPSDPVPQAQAIDHHFFGAILRIDVDKRPGSLPPNPYPGLGDHYRIPPDNPFVGVTNHHGRAVDPARVRTELYAIGLRNPWRFTFDGSQLYCADVGGALEEEINLIRPGGNYGWPFREGLRTHSPISLPGFTPLPPLHMLTRQNHLTDGHCIVGGRVYRGERIPQLHGTYLFGDFVSGRIWSLRHEGDTVTSVESLGNVPGVTTFGIDPANGDVLVASFGGEIFRLIYVPPETVAAPITLAETGVFSDLEQLTPHPGIVPYDVVVPFWSDNSVKRRWFSIPDGTGVIGFAAQTNWSFPSGMIWIKHFELELTNGVPESRQRLETRFIVKNDHGAYGVTYRWGNSRTNALLVPEGGMEETFVIHDNTGVRTQTWIYPSRQDCMRCHNAGAGYALGFTTPQLNCPTIVAGEPVNQIEQLNDAGYFHQTNITVAELPRSVDPTDDEFPIHDRFRSYVNANCSFCHYPNGPPGTLWDARLTTPIALTGIVDGSAIHTPGYTTIIRSGQPSQSAILGRISNHELRMPPLATLLLDTNGIAVVTDYARTLPTAPWSWQDVGTPIREGSSSVHEGVYRLHGAGTNAAGVRDQFHYLARPLAGNGQMIARLVSPVSRGGLTGLMIRSSTDPQAPFCMLSVTSAGRFEIRSRAVPGAETVHSQLSVDLAGPWMRLVREGNRVKAYLSATAQEWELVGEETVELTDDYLAGLAVLSSTNSVTSTAEFDQVRTFTLKLTAPLESPATATDLIELHVEVAAFATEVERVEFFAGDHKIGERFGPPYAMAWSNSVAGEHLLSARATDVSGASVMSNPVTVERLLPRARAVADEVDATTLGNWREVYGAEAAIIAGDSTNLLPHIAFHPGNHQLELWSRTTEEQRAPQNATGEERTAAAWTSVSNLTVSVDLLDGKLHRVSLYFLDWESAARRQLVEVIDAATGMPLASHSLSNFSAGIYLSLVARGGIQVRITSLSGPNAVLSGIFVEPAASDIPAIEILQPLAGAQFMVPVETMVQAQASDADGIEKVSLFANDVLIGSVTNSPFALQWSVPEAGVYSLVARAEDRLGEAAQSVAITITAHLPEPMAELIHVDTTTQGNWIGRYGSDGFAIPGYLTNYPSYAKLNFPAVQTYIYTSTRELRELQKLDGMTRIMPVWVNPLTIDLRFQDGRTHVLALYFLDPERSRAQRLEIVSGITGEVLSAVDLPSFGDGQYYVWRMRGHLKLRLYGVRGQNVVLSGIFFDPVAEASLPLSGVRLIEGRLAFDLLRPKSTNEVPYGLELSQDLVTWTAAGDQVIEVGIEDLGSIERVTYEFTEPVQANARAFVRVRRLED